MNIWITAPIAEKTQRNPEIWKNPQGLYVRTNKREEKNVKRDFLDEY